MPLTSRQNYALPMNTATRALAAMLIVAGVAHFFFPKALDEIVPQFLPGGPRQ